MNSAFSSFLIHRNKSVTQEKRRLLYAKRVANTRKFAQWLVEQSEDSQAVLWGRSLAECGAFLWFRQYHTHEDQPTKLSNGTFCRRPLACPFCASRRAAVSIGRAVPKVIACLDRDPELRPYLLTLTCQNRETIQESYRELFGAYARLLQARRNSGKGRHAISPWATFLGGILSAEVKRGKQSKLWHVHAHAVVLAKGDVVGFGRLFWREDFGDRSYGKGPLAEAWSDLLGYDANCDLRPLDATVVLECGGDAELCRLQLGKDLLEVFKYAMKPAGLSHVDRWAACVSLFHKRLLRSFGCLFRVKEVEQYEDDLTAFEGLPYIESCWRYASGEFVDHDEQAKLQAGIRDEFEQGIAWQSKRRAR